MEYFSFAITGVNDMARYLRLFAVLAVVALLAAACGDSGDEDGDGDGGGSDTQTSATTGSGDSGDTLITLGTLLGDIPGLDDDCVAVANVFAAIANASFAVSGQGNIDTGDAQAVFDQAAANLPGDMQQAVQVMADALISYFQTLNDLGIDFSDPSAAPSEDQIAALLAVGETLDTEEFNAASNALTAYAAEQCPES